MPHMNFRALTPIALIVALVVAAAAASLAAGACGELKPRTHTHHSL